MRAEQLLNIICFSFLYKVLFFLLALVNLSQYFSSASKKKKIYFFDLDFEPRTSLSTLFLGREDISFELELMGFFYSIYKASLK